MNGKEEKFVPLPGESVKDPILLGIQQSIAAHEKGINWLTYVFYGVLVVLFVGFLTMLVGVGAMLRDAYLFKASQYNEYRIEVGNMQSELLNQAKISGKFSKRLGKIEKRLKIN